MAHAGSDGGGGVLRRGLQRRASACDSLGLDINDIQSAASSKCTIYMPRDVDSVLLSTPRFLKLREVPANDHFYDLRRRARNRQGAAVR